MPSYFVVEKLICPHNEIRLVTKINTFFIVFHFDDDEHGLKIKKAKNSFQILVHIRICNFFFFCLSVFSFFAASLLHLSESLHRQKGGASICPFIRPSVRVSVRPSVHPRVWTCCVGACFLFLFPASCLSVGGAVVVSESSTQGRQGQSFGYVHIHGRSMASNKQQHYFRRSNTHTDPSDALAPTLSPAAFQQTSKIPPVPL